MSFATITPQIIQDNLTDEKQVATLIEVTQRRPGMDLNFLKELAFETLNKHPFLLARSVDLPNYDYRTINEVMGTDVQVSRSGYSEIVIESVTLLTPDENRGKQNIFFEVDEEIWEMYDYLYIHWGWKGQLSGQPSPSLILTKTDHNKDLVLWPGMKIWLRPLEDHNLEDLSIPRDIVTGLTSDFGDIDDKWSTLWHHSWRVKFRLADITDPEPDPPTPPPPDPDSGNSSQFYAFGVNDSMWKELNQAMDDEKGIEFGFRIFGEE